MYEGETSVEVRPRKKCQAVNYYENDGHADSNAVNHQGREMISSYNQQPW